MRSYTTKLTRKGQTTIPVELRNALGLSEGDRISWEQENGHLVISKATSVVEQTAGILREYARPIPPGGLQQRIEEEKEAAAQGWIERELRWQRERKG